MKTFRLIGTKPAILSRHNRQSLGNYYKKKRHHIGSAISILVIVIGTVAGGLASLVIAAHPAFAAATYLYASPSGTASGLCTTQPSSSSGDSGVCSLQNALDAAASSTYTSSDAVTIYLEHTNGDTCSSSSVCTFKDDYTLSSSTKASSITIEPSGTVSLASSSNVVLNGNALGTVFTNDAPSGTTVALEGMEITNGSAPGGDGYGGGGLDNSNSGTVNVTDSTISNNIATSGDSDGDGDGYGGGIYNNSTGAVNVTDSTISNNSANHGGGIYNKGTGTVTVTDSTIGGSTATSGNTASGGSGGGIYNDSTGAVAVTGSTISNNSAYGGGGINNNSTGIVTVTDSTISGNSVTTGVGGGINNNNGTVTVTDSTIGGSTATSGNTASGGYGGGIYNYSGTVTVKDSTISGNSTTYGGGIDNNTGSMNVTDSTISGNTSNSYGGGIYNDTYTVNVTDSTISGNTATFGGGIYNYSGAIDVTDSTISGNSATSGGSGGGIYNYSSTIDVTDSTISGNSATGGGGGIYSYSSVYMAGSILDNATGGNCSGYLSRFTDDGYNLSSDNTCGFSESTSQPTTTDTTVPNLDLGTLGNNGGPTETVAVTSSSSAAAAAITNPNVTIGTTSVDLCSGSYNGANLSQDQRGVSRPATSCSAGAYQYIPPPPPAPSITSISPTTGSTSGGTTVTITGDNLSGVAYVFFGSTEATSFTVISSTEIQATSPAESAGAVNMTVTSPGGTSPVTSADQFTYTSPTPTPQPPTVTAISPTSGPTSGGTKVTITGTNFVTGATVKFGSLTATAVTFNSVTSITATSPAESAGTVNVTVTTPGGGTSAISTADQFTYQVPVPTVTAISPTSGSTAGGTKVTITGTNFATGATVNFGQTAASSVIYTSSTSITATSPAESAGTVNVTVTTPVSTSATSTADQFTYITPITGDAYTAVNPASLADTRCSATPQPSYCASENLPTQNSKLTSLSGGASENVTVTGVDNIPSNATAVVINLTVTNMTAGGYLSIYPEGSTQPVVSSLNWTATSSIVTNLVTVPVNTTNGEITITNGGTSGSVYFVVDIEGYYAPPGSTPAGLYNPVTPTRIVDTRCVEYPLPPNITTSYCKSLPSVNYTKVTELLSLQTENIAVTGFGGIPTSGVSAVVLNITAIDPSSSGYLTAFPTGSTMALVSTVNFNQAQTVANEAIVKVGTNGEISIYNFLGATNFTVDVTGYYTDGSSSSQTGSLFNPVTPARILDTRCSESPQPSYCASENIPSSNANLSAIQAGKSITVQVAGEANIPSDTTAVVGNLTATGSAGSGYLTVYLGSTAPTTSDVNFTTSTTDANMVISQLNSSGQMNISASATANALFDVYGWFTAVTS